MINETCCDSQVEASRPETSLETCHRLTDGHLDFIQHLTTRINNLTDQLEGPYLEKDSNTPEVEPELNGILPSLAVKQGRVKVKLEKLDSAIAKLEGVLV